MESLGKQRIYKSSTYRIVVRSELSERFATAFEEMEVKPVDGQTIITGEVTDQSHLHGILGRISALGLDLVSVEPIPEEPQSNKVSHLRMTDEPSSIGRENSGSPPDVREPGST